MARRSGSFRIEVSQEMHRWVAALGDFQLDDAALTEWHAANDKFFDRTQRYVHVLSGDLKTSGRMSSDVDGKRLVGSTEYGGTTGTEGQVDYAIYEIARGGSHDFIGRALASATDDFQEGLKKAITAQMKKNLGGQ